jgi:hypothetical protein
MTKKPHPADVENTERIANSVRFELSILIGQGEYAHATAEDLDQAKVKASELEAQHPGKKGDDLRHRCRRPPRSVRRPP